MKAKKGLAMHVHHNVLFEYCYDYKERVTAIKNNKPAGEQEVRLRLFKMLSKEAIEELPEKLLKADADWDKANADLDKADADWYKADADWYKADADRNKAVADLNKAIADRNKADADLDKAIADWDKAIADWNSKSWHKKHCGCKEWDGEEIIFTT
jgi:hypothetical protein